MKLRPGSVFHVAALSKTDSPGVTPLVRQVLPQLRRREWLRRAVAFLRLLAPA